MSVELLSVFGDDLMVVNAARVSFHKISTEFKEGDAKLINYLCDHHHESPFFHPQIQFRIKIPIFVAREWYRHTIGFSRNEVSRRYVDTEPECWIPGVEDMRERDSNKKQGSKDSLIAEAVEVQTLFEDYTKTTVRMYQEVLAAGVAPEIARTILPQSMYTEFVETGSLAAYARLYRLRTSSDAQREIQKYARMIGEHMEKAFPVSWKALTK